MAKANEMELIGREFTIGEAASWVLGDLVKCTDVVPSIKVNLVGEHQTVVERS